MKNMIKRLPEEVIKKISAGEVIENPASCVRELIENSIDAGADSIVIKIEGGGTDSIEITDNGTGLQRDEIPVAVEHFTTSKINSFEDLKKLNTLGFRGEALYAISQVSLLTIRSSVDERVENGWECEFEAGVQKVCRPAPQKKGTTVIVRDLFFNIPVRRKFLLSKREEGKRVLSEIISYALWHHDIEFVFYEDGVKKLDLTKGDFAQRVLAIFGNDFVENALLVRYDDNNLNLVGFIEKPDKVANKVSEQIILVNGRRVRYDQIRKVIYRAYDIPQGNPYFVIKFNINPEYVDFNIHPQKREIKVAPYLKLSERVFSIISKRIADYRKDLSQSISDVYLPSLKLLKNVEESQATRQLEFGEILRSVGEKPGDSVEEKLKTPGLWQAHNSYIFVQTASGVMIIDQHAAHERILYDKLKKRNFVPQLLMFPILVELSVREQEIFRDYSELFNSFGFEYRVLSDNSLVIDKVPSIFKRVTRDDIKELIDSLGEHPGLPDQLDIFIKTIACKSAIKFGDPLSRDEMAVLVDELFTTEAPFHCPHGRPTIYFISLEELASKFAR